MPWLLIPVKAFARGKSRLAGALDSSARLGLKAVFLRRSLTAAAAFPGLSRTLVVTDCEDVCTAASRAGAFAIVQRAAAGLDAAVGEGLLELQRLSARRAIVLMGDVPMVRGSDLAALAEAMRDREVLVCPNRDGEGTNAVAMLTAAPIPLAFGGASLPRLRFHIERAGYSARQVHNPRIALDVDTPEDLWQWLRVDECAGDFLTDPRLQCLRDFVGCAMRAESPVQPDGDLDTVVSAPRRRGGRQRLDHAV